MPVTQRRAGRVPVRGMLGTGCGDWGAGVGVLGAKVKAGGCTEASRAAGELQVHCGKPLGWAALPRKAQGPRCHESPLQMAVVPAASRR